jgi:hypothetical protein
MAAADIASDICRRNPSALRTAKLFAALVFIFVLILISGLAESRIRQQ